MSSTSAAQQRVDFGRPQVVVRSRRFSLRIPRRTQLVVMALSALALVIALVSLASGAYSVSVINVVKALAGQESGLPYVAVVDWRLPEILLAALFGVALGMSGAIFQSLTRNPLGSPDIIGFDTGAYTGALLVMIVWHIHGLYSVTLAAIAGGLLTAAVVYLFAYRRALHGYRLIIAGIGMTAMLSSVNTYMLLHTSTTNAIQASIWGAGTLNGASYSQVIVAAAAFAILFPAAAMLSRGMRALGLGDDASKQLGVRTESTRLALIIVGVALGGTVTALAGPIAFISLPAPQIAKRLTRSAGVTLGASAATGAVLLLAADWIADNALSQSQPVGVITVILGGGYFVWLLIAEGRRRL